ncbi:GapA-binding peptide SR1P [Paenibacillus dakarensis]|uniref:GapA-binding peptide SR1P n=1 Tax=Paenibacillus dakarensis TaxID=1527293 RepID=UPI000B04B2AD|nr:GapA-binding peptide SR1P [Paenibacillus dakarensis]
MKTLTSNMPGNEDKRKDMGLIICSFCEEVIDTLPTDGVKIIHSHCAREECRGTCSQEL